MRRRRTVQLLLGLALSVFFLWLTLRQINLAEVRRALQNVHPWYLVAAAATYFVDVGVRTWRWGVLLRPVKLIRWRRLYPVTVIGYMGNMLLPARLGELLRAAVLGHREGIASAGLGTIATERVLDGFTAIAILLWTSRSLPRPDWLAAALTTVTILFVGTLVALSFALVFRTRVLTLLSRFFRRFSWAQRPIRWVGEFLDGLQALRSPSILFTAILIGLLAWSCSALQYYWVFRAFDLPLGPIAAYFSVAAIGLSTMVPAAPGYVGTFEFAGVAVLGVAGVPPTVAFGFVLVIHLLQIIPVALVGLFFLWRTGLSLPRLAYVTTE
jgi:uncharacterized protein (TIRG00374 family)